MKNINVHKYTALKSEDIENLCKRAESDLSEYNDVVDFIIKNVRKNKDKALEEYAYNDSAYPIDEEQTISQPFTVAFQTQLLKLEKNEKVLEIGTGSGYQTAILSLISNRVYTIERHHKLFKKSKKTLSSLGYRVKKNIFGDGYEGFLSEAPYNAIIVTAGSVSYTHLRAHET